MKNCFIFDNICDMKNYKIIRQHPIAKFFYKGQSHTHPVRRTVVIIENKPNYLIGYELREGAETRTLKNAPIKTYSKCKIAKIKELDSRRTLKAKASKKDLSKSTLSRLQLIEVVREGV